MLFQNIRSVYEGLIKVVPCAYNSARGRSQVTGIKKLVKSQKPYLLIEAYFEVTQQSMKYEISDGEMPVYVYIMRPVGLLGYTFINSEMPVCV